MKHSLKKKIGEAHKVMAKEIQQIKVTLDTQPYYKENIWNNGLIHSRSTNEGNRKALNRVGQKSDYKFTDKIKTGVKFFNGFRIVIIY